MVVGSNFFLVLFGWGTAAVTVYKVFCLAELPFPGPLARESKLWGEFFCLFSLVFLACQLLHLRLQSRILEAEHKSRELTALWFLGIPASFADLPSLHLFEFSYVCFVYNILGF